MSLNIGDILATLRETTDPAEAFNLLFEFRKEAFQHGAQNILKELIPLVCGSCAAGKTPIRHEPSENWRHQKEGESWACFADPVLKLMEKYSCGKSPATAADGPSPASSK